MIVRSDIQKRAVNNTGDCLRSSSNDWHSSIQVQGADFLKDWISCSVFHRHAFGIQHWRLIGNYKDRGSLSCLIADEYLERCGSQRTGPCHRPVRRLNSRRGGGIGGIDRSDNARPRLQQDFRRSAVFCFGAIRQSGSHPHAVDPQMQSL